MRQRHCPTCGTSRPYSVARCPKCDPPQPIQQSLIQVDNGPPAQPERVRAFMAKAAEILSRKVERPMSPTYSEYQPQEVTIGHGRRCSCEYCHPKRMGWQPPDKQTERVPGCDDDLGERAA